MSVTLATASAFCKVRVNRINDSVVNDTNASFSGVFKINQEAESLSTDFCTKDESGLVTYYSKNSS